MPIIFIESQYPVHKNKDVLAAVLTGLEKYPRPEDLFTPLVETAVTSDKKGLRVLSAFQIQPGKYDESMAYFSKFITVFFGIEGYSYEIRTWLTLDEAMESIGEKVPER